MTDTTGSTDSTVGLYHVFCPVCGIGYSWHEGGDSAETMRDLEAFFEKHAGHRGYSKADRPWIGFLRATPVGVEP